MRFQVPQFIDVEDKIIGPFTFKQFIYLAGGTGIIFILWRALPFFLAIVPIILIGGLSIALAFYKVNNRSFINILESIFSYLTHNKLYLWKKREKPTEKARKENGEENLENGLFVPTLSASKLKDIAWSLDVQESIYASQQPTNQQPIRPTTKNKN